MNSWEWAGEYVSKRFLGCECLGKIIPKSVSNPDGTNFIFVFKLTHDERARRNGRPVGAWYRDGACMVWPRTWLNSHKVIPPTDEELDMIDSERTRILQLEKQRRKAWRSKYGELEFDGTGRGSRFIRVRKGGNGRIRKNKDEEVPTGRVRKRVRTRVRKEMARVRRK